MPEFNLYIVIVTYNNRWATLLTVIKQLENVVPKAHLVVINNGSDLGLQPKWKNEVTMSIEFIQSDTNRGSAWAFGQGLKYALQSGAELILLLDDDNIIDAISLNSMIAAWEIQSVKNENALFAIMGVREDRAYLRNVAKGGSISANFPAKNDFLGFSLRRLFIKLFWRHNRHQQNVQDTTLVKIPCAPYGGLLLSAKLIDMIGYPDERFFVYADDFEYTYRITKDGGAIYLDTNSHIKDITESWNNKESKALLKHKFLYPTNALTYMSIRNSIYFQKRYFTTNNLIFSLNRYVFTVFLLILAIFTRRFQQFKRFTLAVRDGLNGVFNNQQYIQ